MVRPDELACPSPSRTFTFELSPPESPHRDVEYHYAGKQPISRGRTFHRLDTQPYGLRTNEHEWVKNRFVFIRVYSWPLTWSCRSSPEAKDADAPKCRSPVNGEKSFPLEVSGIGPGGPLHRQTAPLPGILAERKVHLADTAIERAMWLVWCLGILIAACLVLSMIDTPSKGR